MTIRRDEDAEIRRFLAAIGAIEGVHVQRVHVIKARLPSGAWLTSTTPGTPDTFICLNGKPLFLEWKTVRGKDEESQKVWHAAYRAAGGVVWVCRDAAKAVRDLADLATGETRTALLAAAERLTQALTVTEP